MIEVSSQRGLTLLELLLVVTILSAVALVSLTSVVDETSQVRFEDTRNRLTHVRSAVLGADNMAPAASSVLSGFVVDNGRLPTNIHQLTSAPPDFNRLDAVVPRFDPVPDANKLNNGPVTGAGAEILLPIALVKGHRGAYLAGVADGEYQDGWGTVRGALGAAGIDCPLFSGGAPGEGNDQQVANHGWCVTTPKDADGVELEFHVASYGSDAVETALLDPDRPFDVDIAMQPPISSRDWKTQIPNGTRVVIRNGTGSDLEFQDSTWGAANKVYAALLIYRNNSQGASSTAEHWQRLSTDAVGDSCLDGNGDGMCGGVSASSSTTAAFSFGADSYFVPAGEHVLVIFRNVNGAVEDADDTTVLPVLQPDEAAYSLVRFHPRGGVPPLEVVIR